MQIVSLDLHEMSGWHFMQILIEGDNLQETVKFYFLEKIRQKNSKCRQLKF